MRHAKRTPPSTPEHAAGQLAPPPAAPLVSKRWRNLFLAAFVPKYELSLRLPFCAAPAGRQTSDQRQGGGRRHRPRRQQLQRQEQLAEVGRCLEQLRDGLVLSSRRLTHTSAGARREQQRSGVVTLGG